MIICWDTSSSFYIGFQIKIYLSRFAGSDNFVIHQILMKFQHYHHYNIISLLQESPIIYGPACKREMTFYELVMLNFCKNLVDPNLQTWKKTSLNNPKKLTIMVSGFPMSSSDKWSGSFSPLEFLSSVILASWSIFFCRLTNEVKLLLLLLLLFRLLLLFVGALKT